MQGQEFGLNGFCWTLSNSGHLMILWNNVLTLSLSMFSLCILLFILNWTRNCILRLCSRREKAARCKEKTKKEKRNYQHPLKSLNLLEQRNPGQLIKSMSMVTCLCNTINILIKAGRIRGGWPWKCVLCCSNSKTSTGMCGPVDSSYSPSNNEPKKSLEVLGAVSSQAPCSLKIDYAREIYKLTLEHLLFAHKYSAGPCKLKVYVCVELSQLELYLNDLICISQRL